MRFRYFFILSLLILSCTYDKIPVTPYQTKNVVVIVMDGPRFSETWGDSTHQYIPHLYNDMSDSGLVNTSFYNKGVTFTVNGHVALTTGSYQEIDNTGHDLPMYPSFLQHWIKSNLDQAPLAKIISSKDKLEVLANTNDFQWKNKFMPLTDCGINGNGTGYREDSVTFVNVMQALSVEKPRLLVINFKQPDNAAHLGSWANYLDGIKATDAYVYQIWQYLHTDPYYKNQTTLFYTNDHGRHLGSNFQSHGDGCEGCRHIFLYAEGPDFKKGVEVNTARSLVDVHATIKELLHLKSSYTTGVVMQELFK